MLFDSIVLLTNYSLNPDRDTIIEDIIWRSEIQIAHLPNTNNSHRQYSTGRIFSPLELESLDAKLLPNYQDLAPEEIQKLRGSIVESLFIPAKTNDRTDNRRNNGPNNGPNNPANNPPIFQNHPGSGSPNPPESSWENYLEVLHTFLNYKAWLLWCAGDRSPLALQKSLLARPESKLLYQKINGLSYEALPHCRFFPSPIATADHLPEPISGLQPRLLETYLDLHPTKNSLNTLRELATFGFTLVPTVQPIQMAGQQAYIILEKGHVPTEGFAEAKTKQAKLRHTTPFAFVSQIYLIAGISPTPTPTPPTRQANQPNQNQPEGAEQPDDTDNTPHDQNNHTSNNSDNLRGSNNNEPAPQPPILLSLKEVLPHTQLAAKPPEERLEKTKHVPTAAVLEKSRELWILQHADQQHADQPPEPGQANQPNQSNGAHLQLNCPNHPFLPPASFERTSHLWRPIQQLSEKTKEQRRTEEHQIQQQIRNLPKAEIFAQLRQLNGWNPKGELYTNSAKPTKTAKAANHRKSSKNGGTRKVSEETWFPGRGNPQAPTWIIGLYPSNSEIESQPPTIFIGPSGIELSNQLSQAGIAEIDQSADIYLDNILRKYEPPATKPLASKILEQAWALKALICLHRPQRLILLGADVLQVFAGKHVSFTASRKEWIDITVTIDPEEAELLGIEHTQHQLQAAATYHPAYVLRSENRHALNTAREDMKQLLLGESVGKTKPPELARQLCREETAFQQAIQKILQQFETENRSFDLGLDTEGENLEPTSGKTISLQLGFCPLSRRENEAFHQVTALFWEKPDPLELTPEEVRTKIEQLDHQTRPEFEFSFATVLQRARAEQGLPTPNQPAKGPLIAVAWEQTQDEQALRRAARTGCGLRLFQYHKIQPQMPDQSELVRNALLQAAHHPLCRKIVVTNLNHDRAILGLSAMQIDFTELEPKLVDTIIAEHIRDESINERGLKACIERHLGWAGYEQELVRYAARNDLKKIAKTAPDPRLRTPYSLFPWSSLEKYAGLDPIGSALVYQTQQRDIEGQILLFQEGRPDHNLNHAFYISMHAVHGIYEMEREGMPIAEEKFRALEAFYERHEKSVVARYQEAIFRLTGEEGVNPRSDQQLAYLLFNKKSILPKLGIRPWKTSGKESELWDNLSPEEQENRNPSVDAESLEIIASNCPDKDIQKLLGTICDTKYILTLRDTFVVSQEKAERDKGMRGKMDPYTHRMHTTYLPTLDTARCRSVPNLANIVRDEIDEVTRILGEAAPCGIRDLVQAIEGWFFIGRDWTAAEFLQLAYLSEDPAMLEIVAEMKNGQDPHALLALEASSQIQPFITQFEKSPLLPLEQIALYVNTTAGREEIVLQYAQRWSHVPQEAAARYVTSAKAKRKLDGLLAKSGNRLPTYTPDPLKTGQMHQFVKKVFSDLRQNAKPVTFGVPYGRTGSQIQKQINRENYKNKICDAQGNIMRISLEAANNMERAYKKRFCIAWKMLRATAQLAIAQHQIQDRWGYIRHFPTGMREDQLTRKAYNWPIQHGVAVVMNQAMYEWTQRRRQLGLKSRAFYTLYDALGWHVPQAELQTVWTISGEVMTKNRPVLPDRPWCIPTDGKIKTNWESGDIELDKLGVKDDPASNCFNPRGG